MSNELSIALIGEGALAEELKQALFRAGARVTVCSTKYDLTLKATAAGADLVLLAVPEEQLPGVFPHLNLNPSQTVANLLLDVDLSALAPATARGARVAGFYPLQMFYDYRVALNGPVGIETVDPRAYPTLEGLAKQLGLPVISMAVGERAMYQELVTRLVRDFRPGISRARKAIAEIPGCLGPDKDKVLVSLARSLMASRLLELDAEEAQRRAARATAAPTGRYN